MWLGGGSFGFSMLFTIHVVNMLEQITQKMFNLQPARPISGTEPHPNAYVLDGAKPPERRRRAMKVWTGAVDTRLGIPSVE